MNSLITVEEVDFLLKRNTPYSQKEIMQLASFSFPSLSKKLNDLSFSEEDVVMKLEGENLYRYLTICRMIIGKDEDALLKLQLIHGNFLNTLRSVAQEESKSKIEENVLYGIGVLKFVLSNADSNLRVKFKGKVPSKMFSFRQVTTDEWFSSLIGVYGRIISTIFSLNGADAAQEALFMQCAWHMHQSQPLKFPLDKVSREDLLNLFDKFIRMYGR